MIFCLSHNAEDHKIFFDMDIEFAILINPSIIFDHPLIGILDQLIRESFFLLFYNIPGFIS